MRPAPLHRLAWLAAAPLALLPACATRAPSAPAAAALAAQVDAVLDEAAATADFNGAVVLMRDGRIVYERALGLAQRHPDRPFTVDTPSDGGSLAKTLTAAAVWELAAEGRLSLDDAVVRHVPEYPYTTQRVRDLVTHRNGLPDYDSFDNDFAPGTVRDTVDLLRLVPRHRPQPQFAPGVRSEYSNLGFDTAALVVERVTGQRIEAWWRTRYFAPLGLQGMFARPARLADWPVPRTPGYRRQDDTWLPSDAYDGEAFIGASNVHASARDWARWGDAFARGRVMAADRLEAGLAAPMLDSGLRSRLNLLSWYCDDSRQRCHYTGAYNGYYAQVWWDRARREVVAYVSNGTLRPWHCARLTRELVAALAGQPRVGESMPAPLRIAAADRARWAGRYVHATFGTLTIDAAGGRLFLRVGDGERVSLFAADAAVFYAPMLDLWLAFSGTPDQPTLHLRSVFLAADAKRLAAPAGTT